MNRNVVGKIKYVSMQLDRKIYEKRFLFSVQFDDDNLKILLINM